MLYYGYPLAPVPYCCLTVRKICTYDAHTNTAHESRQETMPTKITETVRSAACADRSSLPSPATAKFPDSALHVTTRRAFWALTYQPKGINPATGKRWGGGMRHELGDAMLMTVAEARTAALAAKARRPGRAESPPRSMASTASAVARASASCPQPSTKPSTPTPRR